MIRIMFENFAAHLVARADRQRTLDPGTYLFHQGDPVHFVFVVEDGLVELSRHQQDGALIILQRANSQKILAEASLYSDGYHCDAVQFYPLASSRCQRPRSENTSKRMKIFRTSGRPT